MIGIYKKWNPLASVWRNPKLERDEWLGPEPGPLGGGHPQAHSSPERCRRSSQIQPPHTHCPAPGSRPPCPWLGARRKKEGCANVFVSILWWSKITFEIKIYDFTVPFEKSKAVQKTLLLLSLHLGKGKVATHARKRRKIWSPPQMDNNIRKNLFAIRIYIPFWERAKQLSVVLRIIYKHTSTFSGVWLCKCNWNHTCKIYTQKMIVIVDMYHT